MNNPHLKAMTLYVVITDAANWDREEEIVGIFDSFEEAKAYAKDNFRWYEIKEYYLNVPEY